MVNTNAKGRTWRAEVATFLRERGLFLQAVGHGDAGTDLLELVPPIGLGRPPLAIEAKNDKSHELAAWLDKAIDDAPPGYVPVVFIHRRGRGSAEQGYVLMQGSDLVRLLRRPQ